jgi:hypothetical protein
MRPVFALLLAAIGPCRRKSGLIQEARNQTELIGLIGCCIAPLWIADRKGQRAGINLSRIFFVSAWIEVHGLLGG